MATRPLIKESLFILNLVGLNPNNDNRLAKIIIFVQVTLYIHLGVELAVQLSFTWQDLEATDAITELVMIYQIISRVVVVFTNRAILIRLLHSLEGFWPLSKHSSELQAEIKNIHVTVKRSFKFCIGFLLAATVLYLSKPLFIARALPFETYHPVDRYNTPQYLFMYILECCEIPPASGCIVGFDCLFISFIIQIICELRALKGEFANIPLGLDENANEKQCMKKIQILVDHHNLILECIQDMNKIYKSFLLNQFMCSIVAICAGLLTMIANGLPPDLTHLITYTLFLGMVSSQLFVYCAAGTFLINESESVSDAAYSTTNWYVKTQPEIRRAYVMIIQRANKTEQLTAGGMFTLHLESFTSVVRTGMSFFTLVQAMYTRTQ